jgi:hypothetical protein
MLVARYGMVHDWEKEPSYHSGRGSCVSGGKNSCMAATHSPGALTNFPSNFSAGDEDLVACSAAISMSGIYAGSFQSDYWGTFGSASIPFWPWQTSQAKRRLAQSPWQRNLGATFLKQENSEGHHQHFPMLPDFATFPLAYLGPSESLGAQGAPSPT